VRALIENEEANRVGTIHKYKVTVMKGSQILVFHADDVEMGESVLTFDPTEIIEGHRVHTLENETHIYPLDKVLEVIARKEASKPKRATEESQGVDEAVKATAITN
jgi:hypothetical protein